MMAEVEQTLSQAELVRDEVRQRVNVLQAGYLRDGADAVATIARLRHCALDEPGVDPAVWKVTLGELPERLQGRDEISDAEKAIHAALVLYATHQQSRHDPVHRARVGLGEAVRDLADARAQGGVADQATIRRLHQVVLATDPAGRLYYLRSLVTLFRGESGRPVALDYGQLAADLYWLLRPGRASDSVVAKWGRELHNRPRDTTTGEQE